MTLSRRAFLGKAALATTAALVPIPLSQPRADAQEALPVPAHGPIHVRGHMIVRDLTYHYRTDEPIFIVEPGGSLDMSGCHFHRVGGPKRETAIVYDEQGELNVCGAIICRPGSTGSLFAYSCFD